ncbi:MAG: peptidoglycan-binding protein [Cyanobacteria bacterium J06649_4]
MSIAVTPVSNVLTFGSKGPTVRQLQRNLNSRFESLGIVSMISVFIDGFFGPETLNAVKYLQCVGGLPVNGRVDDVTWDFVQRGVVALPILSLGCDSTSVLAVQQVMLRTEVRVLPDGRFDAKTEQAVKAYQQRLGLGVDGIVGPQTWEPVVRSRLTELPCASLLPNPYPA